MRILFLSIYEISDSDSGYIYADLIREFARHGHDVYAVTPTRSNNTSMFVDSNGVKIIQIKNGQIQKTGKIQKAVNLFLLEKNTRSAVKKYLKNVRIELVISMTSSLSYYKASAFCKKYFSAEFVLLVKDIFPQNALDLNMLKERGLLGIIAKHYKSVENKYYLLADYIGYMSPANRDYMLNHYNYLSPDSLIYVPNSIEPIDMRMSLEEILEMRKKYELPTDKILYVYGGNLGKPQGIPFLLECIRTQKDNDAVYFLVVGDGTEYGKIEQYIDSEKPKNVKLLKRLSREDFDKLNAACDVGMIFLNYQFTVPNFPSRLLSYLQAGIPVLVCTDNNTDIGKVAEQNGFGWACISNDINGFVEIFTRSIAEYKQKAENAYDMLLREYAVKDSYTSIMNAINKK